MIDKKTLPTYARPFVLFIRRITGQESPMHLHHGVELGMINAGSGGLILGKKRFDLREKDIYFLDAMQSHAYAVPEGGGMEILTAHVMFDALVRMPYPGTDLRLAEPFILAAGAEAPVLRGQDSLLRRLQEAFSESQSISPLSEIRAWKSLLAAFIELAEEVSPLTQAKLSKADHSQKGFVITALDYLHRHWTKNEEVDVIAAHCSLSASHLTKLFGKMVGETLLDYRNRLRVYRAFERILLTDDKITAVAKSCGFGSLSHFDDMFKRLTGFQPQSLRKASLPGSL
jgi:AraC-like DNA-binding protein